MIAKGGDRLLQEDAVSAIKVHLLRLAEVVTPNIPEAEVLSGMRIATERDMIAAAERIRELGPRVVIVKGGHLDPAFTPGEVIDVVCSGKGDIFTIRGPRIGTRHTHGTGCTFASAIAAQLALKREIREAIHWSRAYLEGAIRHAPGLGRGHGPLNHFWRVY
jgi:hydroxymethylpyrimidine/phosphomethylpyrimidine kinase